MTENYHLRLKPATAKLLTEKISLNFNRVANYKHGKNYTYQNILLDNVQQLANHVIGKQAEVKFNVPLVRIRRNDILEVQRRILTMTAGERKALGISKAGLWYQKKKLAEGKTIKVYDKVLSRLNANPI